MMDQATRELMIWGAVAGAVVYAVVCCVVFVGAALIQRSAMQLMKVIDERPAPPPRPR